MGTSVSPWKRGEALTDRAPEMAATPGSGMAVLGTVKRDLRSVAEVTAEMRKRKREEGGSGAGDGGGGGGGGGGDEVGGGGGD